MTNPDLGCVQFVWRCAPPTFPIGDGENALQQVSIDAPTSSSSSAPPASPLQIPSATTAYPDTASTGHATPVSSWHDPVRYRPSSHQFTSGPQSPPISCSAPVATSAMPIPVPVPIFAALTALQTQLAGLSENVEGVRADVKDALGQLGALRVAQTKTHKRITELEGVIGVGTARGGKRHVRRRVELPQVEDADPGRERTLVQSVTSIQAAIDELLAQQRVASQRIDAPVVDPARVGLEPISSPPRSVVDPLRSVLQLFQTTPATVSPRELGTLPLPAGPRMEYADASIQASLPSFTLAPSCSLSHSQNHVPAFTHVGPATDGQYANDPDDLARSTTHTAKHSSNSSRADRNANPSEPNTTMNGKTHRDPPPSTASHAESIATSVSLLPPSGTARDASTSNEDAAPQIRSPSSIPMPFQTPGMASRDVDSVMSPPTPMSDKWPVCVHGSGEDGRTSPRVAVMVGEKEVSLVHGGPGSLVEADGRGLIPHARNLGALSTPPCVTPEPQVAGAGVGGAGGGASPMTPCLVYPSLSGLLGDDVALGGSESREEAGVRESFSAAVGHAYPRPIALTNEASPERGEVHSQTDACDLGIFSSLLPPTPPRYDSPSGSSYSLPTQDEDEVLNALMLDASGAPTPSWSRPVSPPTCAHDVGEDDLPGTPPQLFAVNQSVLHDLSPEHSTGTLTPLTPLEEILGKDGAWDARGGRKERVRERDRSVSCAGGRVVGGPGATLDELVWLSRREPLTIRLKIPGKPKPKRKRKRDAVDDPGVGERESGGGAVSAWDMISAPAQSASRLNVDDVSKQRAPRKKAKRQSEPGKPTFPAFLEAGARKKVQRLPEPKPRSPVRYHIRKGQLVSVSVEPESRAASPMPMTTALEPSVRAEAGARSSVAVLTSPRIHHRTGEERQALLSSPAKKLDRPSPRKNLFATSSPVKGDVREASKTQRGATWPRRLIMLSHWDAQFVQCDDCDRWYHYGCVGITSGDPRLAPGAAFICPTCHIPGAKYPPSHDDSCARPDCPEPQVTANAELYFVEKLVGRKKVHGYVYMWLAKWEGYPMSDATWIPKENLVGDGTKLFDAFVEEAVAEGANMSGDMVLLREAVDAGWDAQ